MLLAHLMYGTSATSTELPQETMSRQLLMKRNLQTLASGAEVRVIRVNFHPGFKTPLHTHDAEGQRYVVKGRLQV
jgi:quercetin dioxygenase-like cupin family protein